MHIELTYTFTVDDIHEYQRASRSIQRPYRALLGWFLILLVSIGIFLLVRSHREPTSDTSPQAEMPALVLETLISFLPWILFGGIVLFYFVRARFTKTYARRSLVNHPILGQCARTVLTDDALTTSYPTVSNRMLWTHYIRFAETDKLFVLVIPEEDAHILPKRAFPSPAALTEFRAFAHAHIGNTHIGFPVLPPQAPSDQPKQNS